MLISGGICDRCGRVVYSVCHMTKERTKKMLREDGWTIGKDMLCPKCNENKMIYPKEVKK